MTIRYLILIACVIIPVLYSLKLGISNKRSNLWIIIFFLTMSVALVSTILPPIAGDFNDVKRYYDIEEFKLVDVSLIIDSEISEAKDKYTYFKAKNFEDFSFTNAKTDIENEVIKCADKNIIDNLILKEPIVLSMTYDPLDNTYIINKIVSNSFLFSYPYIPDLKHRIKNLNLHVPLHWVAVIAYLISMIYSIKYLKNPDLSNDIKSSSAIAVGLLFTILGTLTGMVWAKFNWGAYWNWDPRQTTILVIMIIYAAYFSLRAAIDNEIKKASVSAVYSILSFITVPFLIFIIPRLLPSLHPGGGSDDTTGPVLSTQADMVDSSLAFTFYLSIAAFLFLYFWILSLTIRYKEKIRRV